MKRKKLVLFLILLFTTSFAIGGGLYCFNIRNCTGSSGCVDVGSLDGCEITCTGSGSASCESVEVY